MIDMAALVPKHAGGRPSLYRAEFCDRIIALGALGYSQAMMAADLGVAKGTVNLWADSHPDFRDALARARTLSQCWWEAKAQASLDDRNFNAALWERSVKSRFRDDYTDRTISEVVGKADGPVEVRDLTQDARRIALILSRAVSVVGKAADVEADSAK